MTTVQVRMDATIKEEFRKILKDAGLTMSAAFNIFARNIVRKKKFTEPVLTENGWTPEQEMEIIRETEYAEKYGKRYTSIDTLMQDLLSDEKNDYDYE
jgi:addiction module RelB/DinJ family antitoxin